MSKTKRKLFSGEFKAKVALEAIRGIDLLCQTACIGLQTSGTPSPSTQNDTKLTYFYCNDLLYEKLSLIVDLN
ncbi:MAG: hypothetical protein ITD29_01885 [Candidatus Nitrotoga sp.]|nr:hypothetical protein [Candidatus Nitrotoga sp.]